MDLSGVSDDGPSIAEMTVLVWWCSYHGQKTSQLWPVPTFLLMQNSLNLVNGGGGGLGPHSWWCLLRSLSSQFHDVKVPRACVPSQEDSLGSVRSRWSTPQAVVGEGQAVDWAEIISVVREVGWTKDFSGNCKSVLLARAKRPRLQKNGSSRGPGRWSTENSCHQLLYAEGHIEEDTGAHVVVSAVRWWWSVLTNRSCFLYYVFNVTM